MNKNIEITKKVKPGFSIIVCAYNAEKRLEKTLKYLASLNIPDHFDVELIVVDNNSTDKTQGVAQEIWNRLGQPFPLHIVEESNPGVANAKKKGVLTAQYQYGIFCDDDNWLDGNYLIHAKEIFEENPQVGVIGGCSVPVSEAELPAWFYTKCGSYAVGIQADSDGDITWRKYVWGAGMCFRVKPFQALYLNGVEHLTIGRKGAVLTSGEDGEISAWFIFLGYKLYYTSKLKFKHFMLGDRLTDEYYHRFFGMYYPSMWDSYSNYLTVRYLLGVEIVSKKDLIQFIAKYLFDLLRITRYSHDAKRVLILDRKIQKIRRVMQPKN
jgi:glycosyltransferase involved in cell wall biosynthesis